MRTIKETIIQLDLDESITVEIANMRVKITAAERGGEDDSTPMIVVAPYSGAAIFSEDCRIAFITIEPEDEAPSQSEILARSGAHRIDQPSI